MKSEMKNWHIEVPSEWFLGISEGE